MVFQREKILNLTPKRNQSKNCDANLPVRSTTKNISLIMLCSHGFHSEETGVFVVGLEIGTTFLKGSGVISVTFKSAHTLWLSTSLSKKLLQRSAHRQTQICSRVFLVDVIRRGMAKLWWCMKGLYGS